MPIPFESLIPERNQRKKTSEWQARLAELERAALPELLATIQDDDLLMREKQANLPLRIKAIQVLAARGDVEAVPHLIALLHDNMLDIQHEAIQALGALGDARAIDPLERIVRAAAPDNILDAARTALQKLGRPPAERALIMKALPSAPDEPIPPETDVQKLFRDIHHPDWRVRRQAVATLGASTDAAARAALLDALRDSDWEVRLQAMQALQHVREQPVVQALVEMIRDHHAVVSQAAMQFAESLGRDALEPLTPLLGATGVNIRENAVRLLQKIRDARVIEPLLRALYDSDDQVRQLANQALLAFGQPVVDHLAQAAKDQSSDTRWKALDAMSRLRDDRMIPALIAALSDVEADIRELAAQTLQALQWQPHTPDEQIAYAIARGVWEMLPPFGAQAIPQLLPLADERNVRVRRYLHETLEQTCAQVKTVVFGAYSEPNSDPKTTVANVDVSALTYPLNKLQHIHMAAATYDFLLVERFFTYAVNVLGEKFLKKNVTVHIHENSERFHPDLLDLCTNLCKTVSAA